MWNNRGTEHRSNRLIDGKLRQRLTTMTAAVFVKGADQQGSHVVSMASQQQHTLLRVLTFLCHLY